MVMAVVLWSLLAFGQAAALPYQPEMLKVRLNYGVYFQFKGEVMPVVGFWRHSVAIALPPRIKLVVNEVINCTEVVNGTGSARSRALARCERIYPIVTRLVDLKRQMAIVLQSVHQDLTRMIPEIRPHYRARRSWLPFVGSILRTVAGSATLDDVASIKAHVAEMSRDMAEGLHVIAQSQVQHASFQKAVASQFDALKTLLDHRTHSLKDHFQEIHEELGEEQQLARLLAAAIKRTVDYSEMLTLLMDFRQSISHLFQGHITPSLIPPVVAESVMRNVTARLPRERRLLFSTLADFYDNSHFACVLANNSLVIMIKFPIGRHQHPFNVYQMYTVPLPYSTGANYSTILTTTVSYFLEHPLNHYVMELTDNPLQNGRYFSVFEQSRPYSPKDNQSCVQALFHDISENVHRFCDYHVQIASQLPYVRVVNATLAVISGVSSLVLDCHNGTFVNKVLQGNPVLIRLGCHCEIRLQGFVLPSSLASCNGSFLDTGDVVSHVVNLPVLGQYFSADELSQLRGSTVLKNMIHTSYPDLVQMDGNFTREMALIDQTRFDLKTAINSTLQGSLLWRSQAEKMAHSLLQKSIRAEMEATDETIVSTPTYHWYTGQIFVFTLFAITLLSLAVGVINTIRLSLVLTTVSIMRTGVQAITPPTRLVFTTPSSVQSTATVNQLVVNATTPAIGLQLHALQAHVPSALLITMWCLIAIIVLSILCYVARRVSRCYGARRTTFRFVLQIGNASLSYLLPLNQLYHDVRCYCITANAELCNIVVVGTLAPKVVISWPGLSIVHVGLNQAIPLQTVVSINPVSAIKVRRILRASYWHMLFTETQGRMSRLILDNDSEKFLPREVTQNLAGKKANINPVHQKSSTDDACSSQASCPAYALYSFK